MRMRTKTTINENVQTERSPHLAGEEDQPNTRQVRMRGNHQHYLQQKNRYLPQLFQTRKIIKK